VCKNTIFKKGIVFTTIFLFIGSGIIPATGDNIGESSDIKCVKDFEERNVYFNQAGEMILIDSGSFNMGYNYDASGTWWYPTETPVHKVFTRAFYMDKYEVCDSQWDLIYDWAMDNGYEFDNTGEAQGANHPVYNVNWYDCVKWCNARSEKEGLYPVYYTDSTKTMVYRTGSIDLGINEVNWNGNGYRLPTEAEWEKASRGRLIANHYPWPSEGGTYFDHIDGSKANYDGSNDPYESNTVPTTPVGYYDGNQTPSGIDMANGYGLYDMAGNVIEWVWDWYDPEWYSKEEASYDDTKGPSNPGSGWKVLRGGSWHTGQVFGLRCALRLPQHTPSYTGPALGFRCVRRDGSSLYVCGDLSWIKVKTGSTVTGSFTIENVGDPDSEINWEITEWPAWGTWTFTPISGDELSPKDGAVTVQVSVVAPDEKNQEFTGEVKIVNIDNINEYCTIHVSLATPKNRPLISSLFPRFFEKFPEVLYHIETCLNFDIKHIHLW
jgi:formylglycine-generating enzyme required for sulfatase activity